MLINIIYHNFLIHNMVISIKLPMQCKKDKNSSLVNFSLILHIHNIYFNNYFSLVSRSSPAHRSVDNLTLLEIFTTLYINTFRQNHSQPSQLFGSCFCVFKNTSIINTRNRMFLEQIQLLEVKSLRSH